MSTIMLTHYRPACLSLICYDFPLWSITDTTATIYQYKNYFSLILSEPEILDYEEKNVNILRPNRRLWLDIYTNRVVMTMKGNNQFQYRHLWELRKYATCRYWLENEKNQGLLPIRLRNYTRSLRLTKNNLPLTLHLEYDLWNETIHLGHYLLKLEVSS